MKANGVVFLGNYVTHCFFVTVRKGTPIDSDASDECYKFRTLGQTMLFVIFSQLLYKYAESPISSIFIIFNKKTAGEGEIFNVMSWTNNLLFFFTKKGHWFCATFL